MGSTVCEPKELRKYLILNETYYINEVSSALCNISGKSVPSLLQNVISHADFTQLLAMVKLEIFLFIKCVLLIFNHFTLARKSIKSF